MSFFDGKLVLEVASASGIEAVVKREIAALGYSPSGANFGRIRFEGNFLDVARANIFLRTAERVRIVLGTFEAHSFDELFDGIGAVMWKEILPPNAKIIVNAKSRNSDLFALSSVQAVAKKAIVAAMQRTLGLNRLCEDGEEYNIEVNIVDNVASVALDCSGDALHKRGYRTYLGDAPLRETLAAAMLQLSVWRPDRPFADPFCGSGTLPIEAALMGLNIASGARRNFAFEKFALAPAVRHIAQQEADELVTPDAKLDICGSDISEDAINLAKRHAKRAGVDGAVRFDVKDMRQLSSDGSRGVIVTNPPYGERLMGGEALAQLYKDFGEATRRLDDWCVYVLTAYKGFEKRFGRKADRVRKLYNAELECGFYRYLAKKQTSE